MSSVPSALTAKLAALRAAESVTTPPVTTPPVTTPPVTTPPVTTPPVTTPPVTTPPADGERVTISRSEYNEMQAAAGRTQAATAREQLLALELEEAKEALTLRQTQDKGTSSAPPASSAPPTAVDTAGITFTDEENTQFGESRGYIEKVARVEAARIVNELMPGVLDRINEVKNTATTVATNVQKQHTDNFLLNIKSRVPNLSSITSDKHWGAYLDTIEPFSGMSIDACLANALNKSDLERMVTIYKGYESKYLLPLNSEVGAGYAGASPTGAATAVPLNAPNEGKLKLSDRRKAGDDFRKGRITYAELQQVQEKFKAAEAVDNIDMNA